MNKFIWLLLVAGVTTYALVDKARKSKQERRIQRKRADIQVWENEGGSPAIVRKAY